MGYSPHIEDDFHCLALVSTTGRVTVSYEAAYPQSKSTERAIENSNQKLKRAIIEQEQRAILGGAYDIFHVWP